MPKYLRTNQHGYCDSTTGYITEHEAEGLVRYAGQVLPCWPNGTPLTVQEIQELNAPAPNPHAAAIAFLRAKMKTDLDALELGSTGDMAALEVAVTQMWTEASGMPDKVDALWLICQSLQRQINLLAESARLRIYGSDPETVHGDAYVPDEDIVP